MMPARTHILSFKFPQTQNVSIEKVGESIFVQVGMCVYYHVTG